VLSSLTLLFLLHSSPPDARRYHGVRVTDDPPPILDYSQPTTRRSRNVAWFLFRRPLRAVEAAPALWIVATVSYAVTAAIGGGRVFLDNPALVVPLFSAAAALTASLYAAKRNSALRSAFCLLFGLFIAVPSGAIQATRCPHAGYLQVWGVSIPVTGEPCRNPRPVVPPWILDS
jgi:hypothetical protein